MITVPGTGFGIASLFTGGGAGLPATKTQKIARVGLVGGFVGTVIYLYISGRRSGSPEARPPSPPPLRTASRGRGQYR